MKKAWHRPNAEEEEEEGHEEKKHEGGLYTPARDATEQTVDTRHSPESHQLVRVFFFFLPPPNEPMTVNCSDEFCSKRCVMKLKEKEN